MEAVPLVLLVLSIVAVGVYPALLTDVFRSGLEPMVEIINAELANQIALGN